MAGVGETGRCWYKRWRASLVQSVRADLGRPANSVERAHFDAREKGSVCSWGVQGPLTGSSDDTPKGRYGPEVWDGMVSAWGGARRGRDADCVNGVVMGGVGELGRRVGR